MDPKIMRNIPATFLICLCLAQSCFGSAYLFTIPRLSLCKQYSRTLVVAPQKAYTIGDCKRWCPMPNNCMHAIYLQTLQCCAYYPSQEDRDAACHMLTRFEDLNTRGCPKSNGAHEPFYKKLTNPTSSTTSTTVKTTLPTTTTPAVTTAMDAMTTEGPPEEETEAPRPDDSLECDEYDMIQGELGPTDFYAEIRRKLRGPEYEFTCFDVCYLERGNEKKMCMKPPPSACEWPLEYFLKRRAVYKNVIFTLCKPAAASTAGTTESVTTASDADSTDSVTEGTDGAVTDAPKAAAADDVTGEDAAEDVTDAGMEEEATGATEAPEAGDVTEADDVTMADETAEGTTAATL